MVDSPGARESAVYAQNMHQAPEGAFTGEVRADADRIGVHGDILGHSERREVVRRDRQGARAQGPGRARGRSVTDAMRRRDQGGARPGRHRAQAPPPGPGGPGPGRHRPPRRHHHRLRADLGDRDRQVATPEQAQEAIAFVRALVGDRSSEQAGARGSCTAAASSPTTPPSCWRCQTSTARWWVAPAWRPSRSQRSSRRGGSSMAMGPGPTGCRARATLIVLDGWGLGGARPRQRGLAAATPVFDGCGSDIRRPR